MLQINSTTVSIARQHSIRRPTIMEIDCHCQSIVIVIVVQLFRLQINYRHKFSCVSYLPFFFSVFLDKKQQNSYRSINVHSSMSCWEKSNVVKGNLNWKIIHKKLISMHCSKQKERVWVRLPKEKRVSAKGKGCGVISVAANVKHCYRHLTELFRFSMRRTESDAVRFLLNYSGTTRGRGVIFAAMSQRIAL